MNILLISQCQKKALKETRRIIDQFAERCGNRVWQTAITKQGLETLHTLLKKTARKNTAVACHWIRGKNKTDLLWIVGDRSQFNEEGRVPTNRTKRKLVTQENENTWQYGTSIQIVSTLAALLHDIGKATIGFQDKLRGNGQRGDPYRHEWISLQLFVLMIQDCTTNKAVFDRLRDFDHYQQEHPNWYMALAKVPKDNFKKMLKTLPSGAKWLGWLIVSHHRFPFTEPDQTYDFQGNSLTPNRKNQMVDEAFIEEFTSTRFFLRLHAFSNWVYSPFSKHKKPDDFWILRSSVTLDPLWLKELKKWAKKASDHLPLMSLVDQGDITDRFLLHFSRLALMLGDHNFSSEKNGRKSKETAPDLIANTDKSGQPKQGLAEHLLGVAAHTKQVARTLPLFNKHLPTLKKNKELTKPTTSSRFLWQNRAFNLAKTIQEDATESGFFGVNMASTGCGKTLGNARIMYGLTDPREGSRLTIALGLRVLTVQTGAALKKKLKLPEGELSTLIGGSAAQKLFSSNGRELDDDHAKRGSESQEDLVSEFLDTQTGDLLIPILGTAIADAKAKKLLFSPWVACTIDHLVQLSECKRGGKYIIPTLRVLTSDLILDEPDDFDKDDLPALARLVYSVGMCGRNVLLSSATLTPDLISGLFDAYQAGRMCWQHHQNKPAKPIICGWFDEFNQRAESIATGEDFGHCHSEFVQSRVIKLQKEMIRRKATIMPLHDYQKDRREGDDLNFLILANQITQEAAQLHANHHNIDPVTQKRVSLGLVRLSHTKNVIALARALYQVKDIPQHIQLHLVVYHARQLLVLRNRLEEKLDQIFNRTNPIKIFDQPEIKNELNKSPATDHLFIVLSTPITEVGRDHDYDWAIIEPSSMRSIIQLAGRISRHRSEKEAKEPNIAILGKNLAALSRHANTKSPNYCNPGFESTDFLLASHESHDLIPETILANINAIPRIAEAKKESQTLAKLEHVVMASLFNTRAIAWNTQTAPRRPSNVVTSYWQPHLGHAYCNHLQLLTPFREQKGIEIEYVCQYNPDCEGDLQFSLAENAWQNPKELCPSNENGALRYQSWDNITQVNPQITPWLTCEFEEALSDFESRFPEMNKEQIGVQFATVALRQRDEAWNYHPWFGFY